MNTILNTKEFINTIHDIPYVSSYDLNQTVSEIGVENLVKEVYTVLYTYKIMNFDFDGWKYRVKAVDSVLRKLKKLGNRDLPVYMICSDLLAFQHFIDDYNIDLDIPNVTKKLVEKNGYKALHLYYQPTNYTYPIEIRLVTEHDNQFNVWFDTFVYRRYDSIGQHLRDLYESGTITNITDFTRELNTLIAKDYTLKE